MQGTHDFTLSNIIVHQLQSSLHNIIKICRAGGVALNFSTPAVDEDELGESRLGSDHSAAALQHDISGTVGLTHKHGKQLC